MIHYLMTWHGHLVGREPNSRVRLHPNEALVPEQLLSIDLPVSFSPSSFGNFLRGTPPETLNVSLPGMGTFLMIPQQSPNAVAFQQAEQFLSAMPGGALRCDRTKALAWETFTLISAFSLDQLRHVMSNSWIVASSRRLVSPDNISIASGPALTIGPLKLPLQYNLPFDDHFSPFRFAVHPDGWKLDHIVLYRPLVATVAFGGNSVDMLCVSLNSLFRIGQYDGRVLVFTDAPEEQLRQHVVKIEPWQLLLAPLPAHERVGFIAGKFAILEEEVAHQCSPIALMDTDIVYNADVRPLLVHMACAGRPSAPLEHFSNLARSPSVGGQLLQRDNESPEFSVGFNTGTVGVPNLKEFGHVLALIRRTMQNYMSLNGRESLRWVDQEVSNYISYKSAHFETGEISRYVRFGWMQDASTLGALTGLVHFWGIPRASRVERMQHYLDLLLEHYDIKE